MAQSEFSLKGAVYLIQVDPTIGPHGPIPQSYTCFVEQREPVATRMIAEGWKDRFVTIYADSEDEAASTIQERIRRGEFRPSS